MARRVFIGLSAPIAYDYGNIIRKSRYPNPILEAPMGLMTLYDEILILHPALCPQSMKNLSFIRFISDHVDLKEYFQQVKKQMILNTIDVNPQTEYPYKEYEQILKIIAPFSKFDNHSRMFEEVPFTPNSAKKINLLFDTAISVKENTNFSPNSLLLKTLNFEMNNVIREKVTNFVISNRIPNYMTKKGPDTSLIEEIRDRPFLKEFRQKIDNLADRGDFDTITELTFELECEYEQIKNQIVKNSLSSSRYIYSTISNLVTVIPEILIPFSGIGTGISLAKDYLSIYKDRNKFGWAGFLLNLSESYFGNVKFSKNNCMSCGTKNLLHAIYCNVCGSKLTE